MMMMCIRSAGQLSGIALRDVSGRYLTAIGRDAVIQSRNRSVSKDEIFVAEHSQPQVFFTAHNGKMISTRQGRFISSDSDCHVYWVESYFVFGFVLFKLVGGKVR